MQDVVIISGASRGIGAATAKLLSAQNYAVCINYRSNKNAALTLADEITSLGGNVYVHKADVSVEAEVIDLFNAAEAHLGPITHLVNNAGILFPQNSLLNIELERFNQVLLTNVTSCFLCSRELIRRIKTPGAIVNVSSAASRTGSPFEYIDYAASKGAIDTLTKGLAIELAAKGVRVNAVRPGFIYTDMHTDGGEPARVDRLAPQIPMQRGGTAEEVANAIAWLLSDAASYVTGSFVDVAGGR